jgi:hypothetical protein
MYDSMPDYGRRRHAGLRKKFADARFQLAWNGYRLGEQRISAPVLCVEFAFFLADRLSLAGEQHLGP